MDVNNINSQENNQRSWQLNYVYNKLPVRIQKQIDDMPVRDQVMMLEKFSTKKKYSPPEKPDIPHSPPPGWAEETETPDWGYLVNWKQNWVYRRLPLANQQQINNASLDNKKKMLDSYANDYRYAPPNVPPSPDMPPPSGSDNVDLRVTSVSSPSFPPPDVPSSIIEEELDESDLFVSKEKNKNDQIDELFKIYCISKPNSGYASMSNNHEFEVKFNTFRNSKKISKKTFENVILNLKSFGFKSDNETGEYMLRMQNQFLNKKTGTFMDSNTRVEILTLQGIQNYCNNERLSDFSKNYNNLLFFTKKTNTEYKKEKIGDITVPDFDFKVSYKIEDNSPSERFYIISSFEDNKRIYRHINRITYTHDNFPFKVDLSIVKSSKNFPKDKFYTLQESKVFDSDETYEIEIEAINHQIIANKKNIGSLIKQLRTVIKVILSGIQKTKYPVSIPEQTDVMRKYLDLLNVKHDDKYLKIRNSNFIGPSTKTLLMENLSEDSNSIKIQEDFVVTEKADGERTLMFIHESGKIYLITQNMEVIFTGCINSNKKIENSLVDGELIIHNKSGSYINVFVAFDIYYLNKNDIRDKPFVSNSNDKKSKSRYESLKYLISNLNLSSVVNSDNSNNIKIPLKIKYKQFYPESSKQTIFDGCKTIFNKINNNLFEYETDGLILSHKYIGVGSNKIGIAGPKKKVTWDYSFKWKPPHLNTIDFTVNFAKDSNQKFIIKSYESGNNFDTNNALTEFQELELLCSYNEKNDGTIYINPIQDVYNGNYPEYTYNKSEYDSKTKGTVAIKFYPSYPADSNAGVCNLPLKTDKNNNKRLFTLQNEVIENNSVVEFSYDQSKPDGFKWTPLRVRYDKIIGNSYTTANSNWKSINNPISEEIMKTGNNIPDILFNDDVYYNNKSGIHNSDIQTQNMKNFHNLFVKKKLIKGVSSRGDSLIDYSCGPGGDLPKWIDSKLSFVLGIDLFPDNIENRNDGACVRYLNSHIKNKNVPTAIFIPGNTSYNIKKGTAMFSDDSIKVVKNLFGLSPKDKTLGKVILQNYNKFNNGFDISSSQFSLHYYFKNPSYLKGFLTNLAECTKLNGYFIGTCFDGKKIYNELKNKDNINITVNDRTIFQVNKNYNSDEFNDDSSSIGYEISVFQESINQYIPEYLVNFDYLKQIMEDFGFVPIPDNDANEIGFESGIGSFSTLFNIMKKELKNNNKNYYGKANLMSENEKKISFLNNYFIFRKVREVNVEKVFIDFQDYNISSSERKNKLLSESKKSIKKHKIIKLNKKLIIENDDDENDSTIIVSEKESKKYTKPKILIVESDSESDSNN